MRYSIYRKTLYTVISCTALLADLQSLDFSADGMNHFLRTTYRDPAYADTLVKSYDHVVDFLMQGARSVQPRRYIQSSLRLFSQKIKSVPYVNPYAFADLCGRFPELVNSCLVETEHNDALKKAVAALLYDRFAVQFDEFKENTYQFFNTLASDITHTLTRTSGLNSDMSVQEFRMYLVRFIDLNLNKLVWSPEDQDGVWRNFKEIADHLSNLYRLRIIVNSDDLDDCAWSLIHRFCYFLQLSGDQLTPLTIKTIKEDLITCDCPLLKSPEQEEALMSKIEHLAFALIEAEARSIAQTQDLTGLSTAFE